MEEHLGKLYAAKGTCKGVSATGRANRHSLFFFFKVSRYCETDKPPKQLCELVIYDAYTLHLWSWQ